MTPDRNQAGVTEHRVRLDDDDNHHIVIDLDFDSVSPARAFAAFLHDHVWGTANSPALVGTPATRILITATEAREPSIRPW